MEAGRAGKNKTEENLKDTDETFTVCFHLGDLYEFLYIANMYMPKAHYDRNTYF